VDWCVGAEACHKRFQNPWVLMRLELVLISLFTGCTVQEISSGVVCHAMHC
jgi:hypothetical protein